MKKITLFFMSLFLVFGTAMAKDEDKVGFALQYSTPQDGAKVSIVYNLRMSFSKDITISQSEINIDVVNSKTNEVVKVTSCGVDSWDPKTAVFSFEKIEVDGKDGKEYKDQVIDKLGTYTYTIPAGLIKSSDGEDFAGGTYTFSIVNFFEVGDWSPKEATEISEVVVTFDREISEVKLPGRAMEILDDWYYSPITKVSEIVLGDDKKSATLKFEAPVKNAGGYLLNLSEGTFVSGEDINAGKSLWFTVVDAAPSFSTNYNDGDRVKELGNLEITFKNVTEFEMAEGAAIIAILPSEAEVEGTVEKQDNKFVVTFDEDFTEEGTYMFIIPEATFVMDGVANEGRTISVELYSFEIVPLEILDVYPAAGETVDQLDRILIKFNQTIEVSWTEDWKTQPAREIELICGDNTYTLTYNSSSNLSDQLEYLVNAEWDGFKYATTPITEAGTYTLDLSQIIVNHAGEFVTEYGYTYASVWHRMRQHVEGTRSWTVSGNASAIENVPAAEGEQVIYDLLGRRVESITGAGIYIVNGKKVVIK